MYAFISDGGMCTLSIFHHPCSIMLQPAASCHHPKTAAGVFLAFWRHPSLFILYVRTYIPAFQYFLPLHSKYDSVPVHAMYSSVPVHARYQSENNNKTVPLHNMYTYSTLTYKVLVLNNKIQNSSAATDLFPSTQRTLLVTPCTLTPMYLLVVGDTIKTACRNHKSAINFTQVHVDKVGSDNL